MLLPLVLGPPWRRTLRVLIPSWRFFEDVQPGPQLWILRDHNWQPPPVLRTNLFLNPEGLLELACRDLVHAFTTDLEYGQPGNLTEWTNYQLLTNLTRQRGGRQFKLTAQGQDLFLSGQC